MIIAIDSSAIIAVLTQEPEAHSFKLIIAKATKCYLSPMNYLESIMVLSRQFGEQCTAMLDQFIQDSQISIQETDARQAKLAAHAFQQYGKGRGHLAQLNLGDCFAYALARHMNVPLLFKGDDFRQTDILTVIA